MEAIQATNGPDEVLPAADNFTTSIDKPVKINFGESEISKMAPMSVPSLLEQAAAQDPKHPALAYKKSPEDAKFNFISFGEYRDMVRTAAKAFLKLGLERFHGVCIMGFNSPEWFISNLAAIYAGGVSTGVYTTNSAEATFYCLEQSRANVAVVEDESQVKKVLAHRDKLPQLKAVVQYAGKPREGVMSWEQLMQIGEKETDEALERVLKTIAVNQCCALIYTSGTVGNPKGVMLSHDNVTWNMRSVSTIMGIKKNERVISYLPLSHVAAQAVDIYCSLVNRFTIYFANRDALKGGLIKSLVEVRPTRFLGVPRVWEKIAEKMRSIGATAGPLKRTVVEWAKSQGIQRYYDLMKGRDNPSLGYVIARAVIFSRIKWNLGLDQCKTFLSGAAPLSADIKKYFASLDIHIMEGFGMSETSGGHTICTDSAFRLESAGRVIPGSKIRIANPDHDKVGEICFLGRNVFMGYVNDREKTEEAVDKDGWLRSGDLGKVDNDGFLYITGRIKELLITSGGENVAPVLIEHNIKAELPFIGQAVVICDRKKFLSLLVTLSCEVNDATGEPTDDLTSPVKNWLEGLGCPFKKLSEVTSSGPDKKILDAIQKGVDVVNEKSISRAQKIQKFAILPKDFSVATGELGPTLKLRRNVINETYKDVIEKIYEE